jgi:Endosomal/lysosomal potassium channel TMEM175
VGTSQAEKAASYDRIVDIAAARIRRDGIDRLAVAELMKGPRRNGIEVVTAQWPTYLAYVASFIYIGVVWVNHHSLFNRIASVESGCCGATWRCCWRLLCCRSPRPSRPSRWGSLQRCGLGRSGHRG